MYNNMPNMENNDSIKTENHEKVTNFIDELEGEMYKMDRVDCPVTHRFTPGLYIREIFMPAGTLLTSKIHKTEHPYVVSQGIAKVWTEESGTVIIKAPFTGITKPGTRRILHIITDTIWTTFHPTNKTDVDEIEAEIIEKHENPFIEKRDLGELNEENKNNI